MDPVAISADAAGPLVSVVIPVLDDVRALAATLASLDRNPAVEVIVVNGGGRDGATVALERSAPQVRWLTSSRGRGRQMNAGASHARGRWLLFLHADTRLPGPWLQELERLDEDRSIAGGSFQFELDSPSRWARAIEAGVAARVRWFDLPYGDQALFARRGIFQALGGYREIELMEDVDFVRRLRRTGRLHHSTLPAVTSARRWETDGWLRRSAANLVLVLLYFAGASPSWLARRYRRAGVAPGRVPDVPAVPDA